MAQQHTLADGEQWHCILTHLRGSGSRVLQLLHTCGKAGSLLLSSSSLCLCSSNLSFGSALLLLHLLQQVVGLLVPLQ